MPATDILNPTKGWDQQLGDSMNPSFGFTRKRANTQLHKKPVGGIPWTRETQNTGHGFILSWLGRTLAVALKLKWYYEQYEDGCFTFIDWDGSFGLKGRHYVGRFTSEVTPVETENNRWDVQGVTFEEMPQTAMVQFPQDWDHEAITLMPFNDFGDQKLATLAAPTIIAGTGPRIPGGAAPSYVGLGGVVGNWGCYEYRGYGFKLFLAKGPAYGQCSISLDGAVVDALVDCYAAADEGAQMVLCQPNVDLDIHRVQVTALGTKNGASTDTNIAWAWLQVMR
jgi:hypothetical protein